MRGTRESKDVQGMRHGTGERGKEQAQKRYDLRLAIAVEDLQNHQSIPSYEVKKWLLIR